MSLRWGETLAREAAKRLHRPVADTTAIEAIPARSRTDGMQVLETTNGSSWWFDDDSTTQAGPSVLVPDAGSGRWHAGSGGGAPGVGVVNMSAVRYSSSGALGAYTRTGNVILADAVGALGAQDGVTGAADDRFLLVDGAADADNGLYQIDEIGDGSTKYQMTRVGDADASAEITAGMLVYISEGTANGNEWGYLTTDDPIVLNTTALVWVLVPNHADLAATTLGKGGDLIGLYDVGNKVTATTLGAAIIENRTALDVAEADVLINRPGIPMINRVIMLGAPGKILQGDYVTIGADLYEFRDDTPPTSGTAGRVWVYNGANSAASRANLIKAINGVVDAALIANEVATETLLAVAGTLLGTVDIRSADAVGGSITPSATATACTENLTTATDLWDQATMYAGKAAAAAQLELTTVTLTADHILQGWLEIEYDFTPTSCMVVNRERAQDEAYTITADRVVLTLAGGGAPNNQAGDVVDILARA